MKKANLIFLILGILVGALGHWTVDFSDERALFNSLYYVKAPGAFLVAFIGGFIWKKSPALNALFITLGVLLGMLSKILFDIIRDPSSHNLFPFELLIGLVFVLPVSFLGSYLAYGIFFLSGKE